MKKEESTIDKLKKSLKEKGISPSIQRLKVYEYMLLHRNHPSVDMIYEGIKDEIPTLSKTTVYNILKLFIKKNLVKAITIEGNELRYDAYTKPHIHFKCIKCGNIYDFEIDDEIYNKKEIDGNKILECNIYLSGICKNCLKNNKNLI
ncbi:MAG TPA: Fur family transcriptional regulator [Caldisericia bacterium]|nr:transcriptional repressor [bacterium]HOL82885.1 Fur family transcriptional regulator [Caldisericia bacterium]